MTKRFLTMDAPGASADAIQAGVTAAHVIFASHGTTASEVALAMWKRETDDVRGALVPEEQYDASSTPLATTTAREMKIADLWFVAEAAAMTACYGTGAKPETAQLILREAD